MKMNKADNLIWNYKKNTKTNNILQVHIALCTNYKFNVVCCFDANFVHDVQRNTLFIMIWYELGTLQFIV